MAFNGNLEDLPFVDVVQLLHVARKSGTLRIIGPAGKADIICRDGDIVGARHPAPEVNLGGILVESGAITEEQLDNGIAEMREAGKRRKPLMTTLIELGHLEKKQGWQALKTLIHRTMAEVISWQEGAFTFSVGKVSIDDDFRHFPEEMESGGVDIKGALIEALRIFDERNRDEKEREKQRQTEQKKVDQTVEQVEIQPDKEERGLAESADGEPQDTEGDKPRDTEGDKQEEKALSALKETAEDAEPGYLPPPTEVLFLTTDSFLKYGIRKICQDNGIYAYVSGVEKDLMKEIEHCDTEGMSVVLVADFTGEGKPGLGPRRRIAAVRRIKDRRPGLPLVVLSNSFGVKSYTQIFELGARTMIPKPSRKKGNEEKYVVLMKRFFSVLTVCLKSVFEEKHLLFEQRRESRRHMASLKRRVHEIQDRKSSPDISLIVLQYIADYMGRGIIFLARKDDLLGLGSFGMDDKGDTISTAVMRLRIPLNRKSVFADVVDQGIVFRGAGDDPLLKKHLFKHIGAPASNEILLLPLKTENKTIALVYCDFGKHEAGPIKTDALEILASQAGMAMEVALQRSRREPPKPAELED